jgi:hypothetical protein
MSDDHDVSHNVHEEGSPEGTTVRIIRIALIFVITLSLFLYYLSDIRNVLNPSPERIEAKAAAARVAYVRQEGPLEWVWQDPPENYTTPFKVDIQGKFKLTSDGDAFRVKYHGDSEWTVYPAKGDFGVPDNMQAGEAEVESAEPGRPNLHIKFYRKVLARVVGGR